MAFNAGMYGNICNERCQSLVWHKYMFSSGILLVLFFGLSHTYVGNILTKLATFFHPLL